jgi:hypothetical protein
MNVQMLRCTGQGEKAVTVYRFGGRMTIKEGSYRVAKKNKFREVWL